MKAIKMDNVLSVAQAAWFAQGTLVVDSSVEVSTIPGESFDSFKDRCEAGLLTSPVLNKISALHPEAGVVAFWTLR